jgi:glutathione S-transferase
MGVSLEPFPRVAGWLARLHDRPSVAAEAAIVAGLA